MTEQALSHKLAAILYADVEGYSRLTGADEAGTHRTLSAYLDLFAETIKAHRGEVKHYAGDAVLADFTTVSDALNCAVAVQQAIKEKNNEVPQAKRVQFRIGLNLGEVIVDRGEVYGNGVNVAARLETLAEPGGICVSGSVVDTIGTMLPLSYEFRGEHTVKNIEKPVRAYRVTETQQALSWPRSRFLLLKRLGSTRKRSFVFAGLAVLIVAAALAWRFSPIDFQREDPILALPKGPSIAVLPFTNLSGDPKEEYFADGITEEIITVLANYRDLFVIARNSSFQFKGQAVDVRKVATDLGVDYLLEGSVRKAAQKIRVTAQLVEAESGGHVWATNYERNITASDIFDLQDEIARTVAATIADSTGQIFKWELGKSKRRPPGRLESYDCLLRAYEMNADNLSPSTHGEVLICLEQSLKQEPGWAAGWAWLAYIYRFEYWYGWNKREGDPLERAFQAAKRAVQLAPNYANARAELAEAHFFRGEFEPFRVHAEQALALAPNDISVIAELAHRIGIAGDPERSVALTRKAMALNPHHPTWYYYAFWNYHYWRQEYQEAIAWAERIHSPEEFWIHACLAATYAQLGRMAEAQAALVELARVYPGFTLQTLEKELKVFHWADWQIKGFADGLKKAGLTDPQ